ncbi:MAG TPA: VOC family protein [Nitrososphaerales archaeon]|nr:VOC family protein [Nitrososphaerales archaeon]
MIPANALKARGVPFVIPPTKYPMGQKIAFFEDPEGNLWESYQSIDGESQY